MRFGNLLGLIIIMMLGRCLLTPEPATALTGFGVGAKFGQVTEYDNPDIKVSDLKFDDFPFFGAFAKFGRRNFDLELGIERFDESREVTLFGEKVKAETRDWITHATAKFVFDFPVIRPFVGAGVAAHNVSYEYSGQLGEYNDITISIPTDKTHFGYHLVAGAKLDTYVLPVDLFIEGKLQKVHSNPDTDFTTLSAGLIFSFM